MQSPNRIASPLSSQPVERSRCFTFTRMQSEYALWMVARVLAQLEREGEPSPPDQVHLGRTLFRSYQQTTNERPGKMVYYLQRHSLTMEIPVRCAASLGPEMIECVWFKKEERERTPYGENTPGTG